MTRIFHITSADEAQDAASAREYLPSRFESDGFIHCAYARQITAVADAIFRGRRDLVLLEIDSTKVRSEVVDENLDGGTELFPHVYGPLPMDAITGVYPFPCREDGSFTLPSDVSA